MRWIKYIGLVILLLTGMRAAAGAHGTMKNATLDLFGDPVAMPLQKAVFVDFDAPLSEPAVQDFYRQMEAAEFGPVVNSLLKYRDEKHPDDWLYYQLIRKTAQAISPKQDNYIRYTLYKWYFLLKSGYDAELAFAGDTLLFYVQCDENIYDVPSHMRNGKEYVCLNYHDYGYDEALQQLPFHRVFMTAGQDRAFSYRLTRVPDFNPSDYHDKSVAFEYQGVTSHFTVRINDQVKSFYNNYPVADYQLYFNVPMSRETYNSLIPQLKEATAGMSTRGGIDYLMRFTRYAIRYETDKDNFGREKRLSPEQTLLYDRSDCEDHSALFFFLVKEIYHLPMLVLAYPTHVTVAVKLDKAPGKPILYNGDKYYICEPTPQSQDLSIGKVSKELQSETYEIAYAYHP